MENGVPITFETTVINIGGSKYISVPPELVKFLNLDIGVKLNIAAQEGKYGKYIAFWRQDQKKVNSKR